MKSEDEMFSYYAGLIWGHRIHDEQTGVMNLLEYLGVLKGSKIFEQCNIETVDGKSKIFLHAYEIPKNIRLRSIVFNNPYIDEINKDTKDPWDTWAKKYNKSRTKSRNNKDNWQSEGSIKVEELQKIFDSDDPLTFFSFKELINILQRSAINFDSEKRWGSKFIFPWGIDCIHSELGKDGNADRRFFGRNGEIIYLLLSQADKRNEVEKKFRERFLVNGNPMNELCKTLQGGEGSKQLAPANKAYIPGNLTSLDKICINIFCDDLLSILSLDIPTPDIVEHLSRIIGLNLLRYFLIRGYEELYGSEINANPPYIKNFFLCEILQKKRSQIRKVSSEMFRENDDQSYNAVKHIMHRSFTSGNINSEERVEYSNSDDDDFEQKLIDKKKVHEEDVLANHKRHWGKNHMAISRTIGLASRTLTNKYRYEISDDLIKTLILCNVKGKRLLLSEFLKTIYERYGIIIGQKEYEMADIRNPRWKIDKISFTHNMSQLIERLTGLGMLDTLSDGYEFVKNPYKN